MTDRATPEKVWECGPHANAWNGHDARCRQVPREDAPSPESEASTRVDQTILADDPKRKGNCVAACVATILGLPLAQVPHFIEFGIAYGDSENVNEVSHGNNWWAMMLGFLAGRGLWVVELDKVTDADPHEFVLVAGMSPRGVVHQVVYREGRLWHDPHPSRAGVLDVREVLAVRALPGFDHEPTRVLPPASDQGPTR